MAIYRGPGGSGDATTDATSEATIALAAASAALASQSAAATSNSNAAASYDSFDDRYLGAKASNPSVDNDGNALLTGALYWNTTSNSLLVWDGNAWNPAAFTVSGSVSSFNTRTGAITLTSGDVTTALGFTPGAGTVTSIAATVPTGLTVSGSPITSSGTLVFTYSAGYSIPTTTKQSQWDTAYSWGNYASAIGTTIQAYDADLTTLGAGGSAARSFLGLAIGTDVQAYNANTAFINTLQTFTASQRGTVTTDNDGSFDMSVTNNFKCTPTATFALTFTNITAGQSGYILLVNTGGYAVTAAATTKVNTSFLTTVSTAGTYLLSYFTDGTNVYVTTGGAMS